MEIAEFLDPFNRILDLHCAPAELRKIEALGSSDSLIHELDKTGYLDALCPEEKGGAGLTLTQAEPLIRAIGAHAAPAEIALEMVSRASDISRPLSAVIHGVLIAGAIETLLSMCVEYANMRVQFGKPIGKQQAIQSDSPACRTIRAGKNRRAIRGGRRTKAFSCARRNRQANR
jgi:acyl-CoA dehydrogenase